MAEVGAVGGVRVEGLRELNRAFTKISADLHRELKEELIQVGEPVRAAVEVLALTRIRNMDEHWARARLGVTAKLVYVVPRSRRRRGSPRPNLADLLLDRAFLPALEMNEPRVVAGLERMLDRLGTGAGF